jgi:hypothetical protein
MERFSGTKRPNRKGKYKMNFTKDMEAVASRTHFNYAGLTDEDLNKMVQRAMGLVQGNSFEDVILSHIGWRDYSIIQKEINSRKEKISVAN